MITLWIKNWPKNLPNIGTFSKENSIIAIEIRWINWTDWSLTIEIDPWIGLNRLNRLKSIVESNRIEWIGPNALNRTETDWLRFESDRTPWIGLGLNMKNCQTCECSQKKGNLPLPFLKPKQLESDWTDWIRFDLNFWTWNCQCLEAKPYVWKLLKLKSEYKSDYKFST